MYVLVSNHLHTFGRHEPDGSERPNIVDFETLIANPTTPASVRISKDLKKRGWTFVGPTTVYAFMFHDRARESYDVAICMYHDQALIPAKALGFDDSVNVTLGLPFIRTSPDHGTAFSLAGKGIAREESLLAALRLAAELARNAGGTKR